MSPGCSVSGHLQAVAQFNPSFCWNSRVADAKISVLSMTEDPNISLFCQFPFSWVLKAYLDELWEKVYHMKGNISLSRGSFNPTRLLKIHILTRRDHGGCIPLSNHVVHLFCIVFPLPMTALGLFPMALHSATCPPQS